MNSNSFSILFFILYFCCATIAEQSSTTPSSFPHSNNSPAISQLYCLGGWNEIGRVTFSVSKQNPINNQWESVTEMPTPKASFGAAVIGKKIYVCGGHEGHIFLNLLEVYDCESNTWTELAPMPNVRDDIGMAVLNGHIYVAGGWIGANKFSSVLKYSPETNTWTEVKAMNEGRSLHELVELHGTLYAIGGKDTNTVERYSPINDMWTYITSTNHNHSYLGATSHQNKIYVLSDQGFEVFDPKFDIWKDLPSLNIGNGVQLVSINDKLLMIGGGDGNNKWIASKTVYEFDTINNSWIHLPDMDAPRKHHRAVVVNF